MQFPWDSPSLARSRVLTETQGANPLGATGKTVTYALDAEGNQTEIDYPSGFEAHRTFDELNRLTLLEDASSNDIAAWTRYGAANRRDVLSYENGTTTTWGWDGFRRPTTITHEDSGSSYPPASPTAGCVALFRAPHGGSDNPTFEARSHQSGTGDTASPRFGSYDRANRLTRVLQDVDDPANEVANPGAEAYGDKVPARNVKPQHGRRAGLTSLVTTPYGGSGSSVSYSTNAMNEYTSVGGTSHSYDDNGNLIDDGTYEYVYDAHNHLIEVIDSAGPTTIATYTYDALGLGRRTSKTVGSDTTRFVYANQQCLEEYDGSGNLLRLFAFGQEIDEVAMMEAPDVADVDGDTNTTETKRFYYHTQLLGSVTQVTDPDEVVVESYDYGPYGEITIKDIGGSTVSTSQIGNPFTYTGRRLDEESGLYYYRARHYSAELRRFIQTDPLEYVDGPNALAYALCGPTLNRDPRGLSATLRDQPDLAETFMTGRLYDFDIDGTALFTLMDWRDVANGASVGGGASDWKEIGPFPLGPPRFRKEEHPTFDRYIIEQDFFFIRYRDHWWYYSTWNVSKKDEFLTPDQLILDKARVSWEFDGDSGRWREWEIVVRTVRIIRDVPIRVTTPGGGAGGGSGGALRKSPGGAMGGSRYGNDPIIDPGSGGGWFGRQVELQDPRYNERSRGGTFDSCGLGESGRVGEAHASQSC